MNRNQIHLALRHDGVTDRNGRPINSSVTQVDVHDFCRLTLTYGLAGFHCVTPLPAQHQITQNIIGFWRSDVGKRYNPDREQALTRLQLHQSFDELETALTTDAGEKPLFLGTSARPQRKSFDFDQVYNTISGSGRQVVIQFGTAWGLSEAQLNRCDWVLPPINGYDGYNHLSVRCAAAILLDRFLHSRIDIR